jgi:hypothetical protein
MQKLQDDVCRAGIFFSTKFSSPRKKLPLPRRHPRSRSKPVTLRYKLRHEKKKFETRKPPINGQRSRPRAVCTEAGIYGLVLALVDALGAGDALATGDAL